MNAVDSQGIAPGGGDGPVLARDLRFMVSDAVFFSVMVGLGEAYVPAFALAVGLGAVGSGLVATLPILAGACFQLVTPWAVRRLDSYRRWVALCAALQGLSFLPLVGAACLGAIRLEALLLVVALYWSFGMATSPAWNAWVTSLVPTERRARFFAGRSRASQAALLAGIAAGGLLLELGRRHGMELGVFAAIFGVAGASRLVSASYLRRQSERPGLAASHPAIGPGAVLRRLRGTDATRTLGYLLAMQLAVNVAAPFFTPYMLGPLRLGYDRFMVLTAAAFLARILVLPALGRAAHRYGVRRILYAGAAGIAPLPLLWLVSHDYAWLLAVQVLSGVAWGAVELSTMLAFFEGLEERHRASILTAFNFANAVAMTIGSTLGVGILQSIGGSALAYATLFGVSSAARLGALLLLRRTPPLPVPQEPMELRTLAVRPAAGAIQRPILATVADEGPEAPASGD